MRAIISRALYIFYPIFHCGLYCRAVTTKVNLYTKQGNSDYFRQKYSTTFKIVLLLRSGVPNQLT